MGAGSDRLAVCLVGCGRMGLRHLRGYAALRRAGVTSLELVGVCDADPVAAGRAADGAEDLLGRRPAVHADVEAVLADAAVEALDVATDPASHHVVCVPALASGRPVICEKPLGVTVRACRAMVAAAEEAGVVLAVAENYRHDPVNRLAARAVEQGVLGTPRLMVETHVGGTGEMILSRWRHQRERGAIALDMGVHLTDIIGYYLGAFDAAFGRSFVAEPLRRLPPKSVGPAGGSDDEAIRATGDDTLIGAYRMRSGALAHLVYLPAGPGGSQPGRSVFGSEATMLVPPDRSGRPVEVRTAGAVLSGNGLRDAVGGFELTGLAATLFGPDGTDYQLDFDTVDADLVALELADFAAAVGEGRPAEVDGTAGTADVAAVLALAASEVLGTSVLVADVADGTVTAGQDDIDAALGLTAGSTR